MGNVLGSAGIDRKVRIDEKWTAEIKVNPVLSFK